MCILYFLINIGHQIVLRIIEKNETFTISLTIYIPKKKDNSNAYQLFYFILMIKNYLNKLLFTTWELLRYKRKSNILNVKIKLFQYSNCKKI